VGPGYLVAEGPQAWSLSISTLPTRVCTTGCSNG
jgi:hypothetical protein